MVKKILSTIFLELFANKFLDNDRFEESENFKIKNHTKQISDDLTDRLENSLKNYLNYTLGFKINSDNSQYFKEIKRYISNIVDNYKSDSLETAPEFIDSYTKFFLEDIERHYHTSLFIDAMKNTLSDTKDRVVIGNVGRKYTIEVMPREDEEIIPVITISDIDSFEETLQSFIDKTNQSESLFKNLFSYYEKTEAETKLYEFVTINATNVDLEDINKFFIKYQNFISDKTFDEYRRPTKPETY